MPDTLGPVRRTIINPVGGPDHDEQTIAQLDTCAKQGDCTHAVLSADGHFGYSAPVGATLAYASYLSPSAVGYDIACGNKAVATNLLWSDISGDIAGIMDEVAKRVSFGVGVPAERQVDHPVLDRVATFDYAPVRNMVGKARKQLGSVGAGNHFVDLFRDVETDRVWVGVHFGSRGFGWLTAAGFMSLGQGGKFEERPVGGEALQPPILIHADSSLGYMYAEAMQLAGDYAYAGRDVVCDQVLEILGAKPVDEVHNHHNFAWRETHDDQQVWVHRKGATPLFPGQRGFIGATMGEDSVIVRGFESPLMHATAASAPHGAGRAMSRTKAAGKVGSVRECNARDCDFAVPAWQFQRAREELGLKQHEPLTLCTRHPDGKMIKRRGRIKTGLIDYDEVLGTLSRANIQIRGGAADEAPDAYKRLSHVLQAHDDQLVVETVLRPVGVVMAGPNVSDPYKD